MIFSRCSNFKYSLAAVLLGLLFYCSTATADWRIDREVCPGVRHTILRRETGPWEINIIRADLTSPHLSMQTLLANGTASRGAPLSFMVRSISNDTGNAVAAINGDFFSRGSNEAYSSIPIGLQIRHGELITFPRQARSALLITSENTLSIEKVLVKSWVGSSRGLGRSLHGLNQFRGAQRLVLYTPRFGEKTGTNAYGVEVVLKTEQATISPDCEVRGIVTEINTIGNTTIPRDGMVLSGHGTSAWFLRQLQKGEEVKISIRVESQSTEVIEAIGGGPRLVRQGGISVEGDLEVFQESFITRRHPRTAVGFSEKELFFVTVDGRMPGRSEGMTLHELAALMSELGCKEALNLDGGGSTEMIVKGIVTNTPSDGRERTIANGLLIISKLPRGIPTQFALQPSDDTLLENDIVFLRLRGWDSYFGPCLIDPRTISWKLEPAIGTVSASGEVRITEKLLTTTTLKATAITDLGSASCYLKIFPLPSELRIVPERASVYIGEGQQFMVEGNSLDKRDIPSLLLKPTWNTTKNLGIINDVGYFKAGKSPSQGKVFATIGDILGIAEVLVGSVPDK